MILVFGRNADEARQYVEAGKQNGGFGKRKARVACCIHNFIGYREAEVHLVGSYKDNPVWPEVLDQIKSRDYRVREIGEWR